MDAKRVWLRMALAAVALVSTGLSPALHAQGEAAPAATPAPPPPPTDTPLPRTQAEPKRVQQTVNLDQLLADPLDKRSDLQAIVKARVALAHSGGDVAAFESTAQDFARRGAWYPAISLLWFAEKLTDDLETRKRFGQNMQMWLEKGMDVEAQLGAAGQMIAAKRVDEGMAQLNKIRQGNPFSEKAAFQSAQAYYNLFAAHDVATKGELPLETRVRLFRIIYEQYCTTLIIDPLFLEGYYGLSRARDVLGDSPALLDRTEPLVQRAIDFESQVVPLVAKLDDGDRSAQALIKAGDALQEAGVYTYAAFLYQAALTKPDIGEMAAPLQAKLQAILQQHLGAGALPSPAVKPGDVAGETRIPEGAAQGQATAQ